MSSYRPKGNVRFFAGRCKSQTGEHGFCRRNLGVEIQVGVDVGRGGKVAVAQPFLNLLHAHAVGQQEAGAGVPLRYNKDKRKNPVFSRVSAFVVAYSIPFPTLIVNEKSVE